MSKHIAIGIAAVLCLVLAGCGSDGPNLRPELEKLTEQVEEQTEQLGQLETDLDTEREEAIAREEELQEQLDEAREETEAETQRREDAERREAEARDRAERRAQEAEQEAAQRIEQANMSLRASKLLTALNELADGKSESATVTHGTSPKVAPQGIYSRQSAAPSISGFRGDISTHKVGNTATDTVYLYTNIKAPGSRAFWKVHGTSVPVAGADMRATGSRATHTVNKADNTMYSALKISGSFDGASGTFACADCTGTIATSFDQVTFAEGKPNFVSGTWIFEPGSLTAGVPQRVGGDDMGERQDSEFLYFGIWSHEPNDASATTPAHDVKWIGGGDGVDITNANFEALRGQAKFVGGAVGRYALTNQVGQADRIGTFTAKAEFTAVFGDTSRTLEGDITNFHEGGRPLGSDWIVYLGANADGPATLTETGVALQGNGAIASIGGVDVTGDWNATLHGSDNKILTTILVEDYTAEKYPAADLSGVAGWFEAADTGVGVGIVGAFGAACSTGPCGK